ncbi:LPS export ABC transporter periplasmic protein LptC [Haemophilus parahaemolyticus]|uniref:Lipopolysaccharide export system protein LptC n=2 Tax=Haemophilus parahaemolyticus TaxID=735 RepID=A0AAE6JRK8_HAEPH|nr:LPS export ABC transporter periplasmic protein LptC [Haemophilus parahaemolyticus]EIJ69664.1 putative lipopolysaccharide export system protein LptC [Haemophilus parahaemolyticus HK385]OOR96921.1 LPS export ABC transporter periplasmic protein LptC [Haemophilus parahaemolyticus]QEN10408.1 LPS export ABC transporter periplasmic protein LptC [Haemophilus parahaemolyticus]QRP13395.1 LPS export ABC transporter periplasmic protein LptC [Haemophilus parahaemolyticus]STO65728.1 Lipooligosaccharide t
MNKRITALLLVIVATLLGWMQYQAKDETNGLDNLIKKEGMPDYTGNRMSTSVFDLEGKPEYYAEAEEIKRYEESEKTEFTNPLVNLFDKLTALKQWKLSADHAEINAERILTLSGNVTLQALEPTSKLQRIETDHLSVNLTTQDVFTDSEVKSQGLGFTTSGIGLKGNLKQQVATLLKDVKSYIEPTVIKAANEQEKDKQ